MSDFRLFCFGLMVSIGGLCALENHDIIHARDGIAGIIMMSVSLSAGLVVFFGKRRSA